MNITEIKELLAGTPTAEQLATLAADERKGVQKLLAAYNKRLGKAAAEKERFTAMLKLERELYVEGCELIAGVDEAGRGPLAGPLVIAAVILPKDVFISGLNDSKQLSAAKRDMLYNEVMAKALDIEVNIVSVSNIDELKQYVNMRLNSNGEPENLTRLDIRSENGKFTVDASGEGKVEKILYGGSETVPTAPGTYPVTCVVRLGGKTFEFQIGTLIVPEPPAEAAQPSPVYHVTDADGNQISYTAAREGGVLTIRVDAAYARLTLTADEAQALTAQGVEKVVFITTGATSAFRPADLTAYKDEAPFVLTHDGETVTFTAGETDLASLLLQA